MANVDTLSTNRMVGTRLTANDEADLFRMHSDPQVMASLGGSLSAESNAAGLHKQLAHWNAHGFGYWAWRDTATGEFLGRGGIAHCIVAGRSEVEVGYAFNTKFWGSGLATEMTLAVVEIAFDVLGLQDLACFTMKTNAASEHVMQKAGFTFERDIVYADAPHVLYRRRAHDEFAARRISLRNAA